MTISLKHLFQSAKTDGPDNTIVQPSDWNDEHVLTQATGKILGRTSAGTGATEEIAPGTGITLSAGTISADVTSVAGRTGAVTLSTADISGLTTGYVQKTSSTGAAALPASTTGDRPGTPLAGYIRYNTTTGKFEGYGSAWGNIGGGAAIGDTPPANPGAGDLWWNSADGRMYVYYTDANSSQWVDLSAGGAGQYLPLTGGTVSGNFEYTGTLTGGTDVINIGSGQIYKDASGNVGIGTSSPSKKLVISNAGAAGVELDPFTRSATTGASLLAYNRSTSAFVRMDYDAEQHLFFTGATERARIDSAGKLHIGQTSHPGSVVRQSIRFTGGGTEYGIGLNAGGLLGGTRYLEFNVGSTNYGSISWSGSSIAYNTTSDYRVKENINEIVDALTKVKQLRPVTYNFTYVPDQTVSGFIAHELQEVIPEAVTGEKDAISESGDPIYQGVDLSKVVPLLTKAIQEQQAQIEALKADIEALKGGE